jgi:tetratricopeptide (TPR) repeat protein
VIRNLLLSAVTLGLVLGVLEAGFRALEWVRESRVAVENPYIRAVNVHPAFEPAVVDAEEFYVRTPHQLLPRWPHFTAHKDANTFRIFCLGGSAAMGWPHPGEWAYPALLQRKLERLYPQRRFEVINAAGNTYASYRVKIVFDEVLGYEPDAIVVYSGNNEFLENVLYRPPGPDVPASGEGGRLAQSALARFVGTRLANLPCKRVVDVESYGNRDQVANRLSFAFGRASKLRSDPEQYRTVVDHYVYNLEALVAEGRRQGVPVVLATVPVNLRDWRPNASMHGDLGDDEQRGLEDALRTGILALDAQRFDAAQHFLERAAAIDPGVADTWFDLGRARLGAGRAGGAEQAFRRALALDGYPFRSLFGEQVRKVAQRTGAPLADLSAAIARESEYGLPGFDRMLDYVHPTASSNEIIAQEVLATLLRAGLLPDTPALPIDAVRIAVPEEPLDHMGLRALFGQTLIMRQYDRLELLGPRLRRALVARNPGLPARERGWNTRLIQQVDRTLAVIRPYRELLRAERLGMLEERFTQPQAEAIFADYVALIRDVEGKHVSDAEFESYLPQRTALGH